jgi:hypothetical protein
MIKKIIFFTIFLFACFTSKLSAGSYVDNMYSGCSTFNKYNKARDKSSFNEVDYVEMMLCKSYIIGWSSAGRQENFEFPRSSKKSSIGCYNSHQIDDLGARSQVVSRMFVQFLDNNPKYFELTMEEIMWDLHNEYFKC